MTSVDCESKLRLVMRSMPRTLSCNQVYGRVSCPDVQALSAVTEHVGFIVTYPGSARGSTGEKLRDMCLQRPRVCPRI